MATTLEMLRKDFASGRKIMFVFFWGHQVPRDGSVSSTCFSQWYPAPFEADGQMYPTAEHWMMAEKARLFGDDATLKLILASRHPRQAKQLGRQVRGFDEGEWQRRRYEIVVEGNIRKFGQNEMLGKFLAATGRRVLVEASPVDRIWGIGLAADDNQARNPTLWKGLNLLGFALMEVRERLHATTTCS